MENKKLTYEEKEVIMKEFSMVGECTHMILEMYTMI